MTHPVINEYDLELTAKALKITNPGRASEAHIRDMIRCNWPFDNLATAGWVAYAEAPDRNNNVRVALTPYTAAKHLELNH
jgi:hypothetical protein